MHNAPTTFQRLVNIVLSGLSGCEAYLDDLVIYSDSWQSHVQQIREVLERLCKANLMLNLAKCELSQVNGTYLGKVVGRGELRSVWSKVEAILAFPAPVSR